MSTTSGRYEIKNFLALAFLALASFLIIINVLLLRENIALKGVVREFEGHLAPQEGSVIPTLYGHDPEKKPLVILQGTDSRKTVLLIFSPQCANCEKNWPVWHEAIQNMDIKRFRAIAINLANDLPQDYLAQHHVTDMPILAELGPQLAISYNFQLTPLTVLLDSKGRVDKVWIGILAGKEKREFEQTLRTSSEVAKEVIGGGSQLSLR